MTSRDTSSSFSRSTVAASLNNALLLEWRRFDGAGLCGNGSSHVELK